MTCKCRQCFGLAEYMHQTTGSDFGLAHAEGHSVEPPAPKDPCDESMTCACGKCEAERVVLMDRAQQRRRPRQPWDAIEAEAA